LPPSPLYISSEKARGKREEKEKVSKVGGETENVLAFSKRGEKATRLLFISQEGASEIGEKREKKKRKKSDKSDSFTARPPSRGALAIRRKVKNYAEEGEGGGFTSFFP